MAIVEQHYYLAWSISGLLAILLSRIIYNLFFHPLARIPGPWLPACTSWYEVYFDCIYKGGGQYPFHIRKLHEKYGPIIRPVPNQVHISDPAFLDIIYATRNRNQMTSKGLNVSRSIGGTEDFKLHRIRREAMNPFFTIKTVELLQSLFINKKNKVKLILADARSSGSALNISDVYFAYANDIVRAYSFGSDDNLLDNLVEANRQRNNLSRLLTSIHVQRHFSTLFRLFGSVLPIVVGAATLPPGDTDDINKGQHSIFYELRDSSSLPPEEKTTDRLQDEATLIVMAGTESTAKSLGIATFYLLNNPQLFKKLRAEIEAAKEHSKQQIALSDLLKLPYLTAVITEANRLSFGVTNRMIRYSPDETLTYTASYGSDKGSTYVLPPKTLMSTLTYCTHTNESLFPKASEFNPDRWIINSEMLGNCEAEVLYRKRCMHALGKGHRRCIGINVANAALSLMLAELVNYDLALFETDENDVKFQNDFQISHPKLDSQGIRVKVKAPGYGYH